MDTILFSDGLTSLALNTKSNDYSHKRFSLRLTSIIDSEKTIPINAIEGRNNSIIKRFCKSHKGISARVFNQSKLSKDTIHIVVEGQLNFKRHKYSHTLNNILCLYRLLSKYNGNDDEQIYADVLSQTLLHVANNIGLGKYKAPFGFTKPYIKLHNFHSD